MLRRVQRVRRGGAPCPRRIWRTRSSGPRPSRPARSPLQMEQPLIRHGRKRKRSHGGRKEDRPHLHPFTRPQHPPQRRGALSPPAHQRTPLGTRGGGECAPCGSAAHTCAALSRGGMARAVRGGREDGPHRACTQRPVRSRGCAPSQRAAAPRSRSRTAHQLHSATPWEGSWAHPSACPLHATLPNAGCGPRGVRRTRRSGGGTAPLDPLQRLPFLVGRGACERLGALLLARRAGGRPLPVRPCSACALRPTPSSGGAWHMRAGGTETKGARL